MKVTLTKTQVTLATAVAAGAALASGCCSHRGGSESIYGYSEPRSSSAQAAETGSASGSESAQMNSSNGTNTVIPLYKENLAVGKREVDAGTVRVKKVVKTETVNQPVELRHEEIVIEREPASGTAGNPPGSAFQDQETVIHLTKEEPVVEKQTTSAGQIVVQTRSASTQTNIQGQIRSEDVAVVKSGNPQNVIIGQNVQQSGEAMGGAESPSGQASGQSWSGTITDPAMLSTGSAASLSGRSAQFSNLKVQSMMGDHLARCDAGNGQSLYIYSAEGAGNLKPGDSIDVNGTVKTGASDLSGTAAQVLSSQSAYIDAQKIEPSAQ